MSEFVRVRKDELDALRKDVEVFIQHHETSSKKIKDLIKENTDLKEQLQATTDKLTAADQKVAVEVQQTTALLQRLRANMSHVIQETEKEMRS